MTTRSPSTGSMRERRGDRVGHAHDRAVVEVGVRIAAGVGRLGEALVARGPCRGRRARAAAASSSSAARSMTSCGASVVAIRSITSRPASARRRISARRGERPSAIDVQRSHHVGRLLVGHAGEASAVRAPRLPYHEGRRVTLSCAAFRPRPDERDSSYGSADRARHLSDRHHPLADRVLDPPPRDLRRCRGTFDTYRGEHLVGEDLAGTVVAVHAETASDQQREPLA